MRYVGAMLLILLLSGTFAVGQAPSSPPLFSPGQTYVVVWDCAPEYLAQLLSQQAFSGQPLNPCYSELLTVQAVRSDGWVLVTDDQGNGWTINSGRMIGFKVAQVPVRAAR